MEKKRLPEWLRKLFYEWSNHVKVERALQDKLDMGIKIGEGHTPPPVYKTVVHLQNCNKHGVPLIEREHEPGVFDCPLCRQFSGPMQPYTPGSFARAWRDRNPTMKLDTEEMEAIRIKNYGG
jgi:hypothetical protein